jgi:hypothetical protein
MVHSRRASTCRSRICLGLYSRKNGQSRRKIKKWLKRRNSMVRKLELSETSKQIVEYEEAIILAINNHIHGSMETAIAIYMNRRNDLNLIEK